MQKPFQFMCAFRQYIGFEFMNFDWNSTDEPNLGRLRVVPPCAVSISAVWLTSESQNKMRNSLFILVSFVYVRKCIFDSNLINNSVNADSDCLFTCDYGEAALKRHDERRIIVEIAFEFAPSSRTKHI